MAKPRAPLNLDTMKAAKPSVVPARAAPPLPTGRKGMTLRLEPSDWKRLKVLAIEENKTSHDLIIEGLALMFARRGLPGIET